MPLRGSSCSSFLQASECKRGGEGLQVTSAAASWLLQPVACCFWFTPTNIITFMLIPLTAQYQLWDHGGAGLHPPPVRQPFFWEGRHTGCQRRKKKSVRPNVTCLGWEWERDERTGEKWRNRKLENGNTSCLIRGCQKVSIMSVDMYSEVFPPLSGAGNASITHHKESEGLLGMGGVRMPPFIGVRGESASPGYLTPHVCMLLCVVSSGQLSHPNFSYCFSSSSSLQCKLDTVNKAVFYWCRPRVYWCVHFALSTLCSDSGVPAMK